MWSDKTSISDSGIDEVQRLIRWIPTPPTRRSTYTPPYQQQAQACPCQSCALRSGCGVECDEFEAYVARG